MVQFHTTDDATNKDLLKVAVVGPECTGKSSLSEFLAKHYRTEWVPEYARGYLDNLTYPYEKHDLITIAHGQLRIEDVWAKTANKLLICDTNLLVIKVWSEFKFGDCDEEIIESLHSRKYDLYLLTYIDVPWEADPQREHPDRREELYKIYLNELKATNAPFTEIRGEREERRNAAMEAIDHLLDQRHSLAGETRHGKTRR